MNKSLVLLSGEPSTIPEAEAKALFLTYDPSSTFASPEKRVLVVQSKADPSLVASRIAFARRVGSLLSDASEAAEIVRGKKVRAQVYRLGGGEASDPAEVLGSIDAKVDLTNPDFEFTVVDGKKRYVALTSPSEMGQRWHLRRPRHRAFFHPSAIFPKLSRALVNMSRCKEGQVFLDPFAGTSSLPLEAGQVGALVIALDLSVWMTHGSLANMKMFGQEWLGVVRGDSLNLPLGLVDAIATDVPYGRASSTGGRAPESVVQSVLETTPSLLRRGSRMVLMHSSHSEVKSSRDWALEEEHNLYVHKSLTRTISVLRRG